VGHAIPWIHLPQQIYGWEIVNYNGANLRYRDEFNGWFVNANSFVGTETNKDSGMWKIYSGKNSRTSTKWNNIVGSELKLSKGWFDVRAFYMQSNTQNLEHTIATQYSSPTKQNIRGVSVNTEFGKAFVAAEFLSINRKADYGGDTSQLIYAGYRLNKFTPLISFANYKEHLNDSTQSADGHRTTSAVLRYDIDSSSALKMQLDFWKDRTGPGFSSQHGDSKLLSISFDRVF
jgi:predicted porin